MHKIVHAAFVLVFCGASAAQAQEAAYAGLAVGTSKTAVTGSSGQRVEHHNDPIKLKAHAGYALNEHFAIEGGYAGATGKYRFDKAQFGAAADPQGQAHAVYAALRGKVAVSESVDLFAKLGVAHNRFKLEGAGSADFDVSAAKPMAGVGAAYRLSDKLALTAEFEHYGRVREGNRRFTQNRAQAGIRFDFR